MQLYRRLIVRCHHAQNMKNFLQFWKCIFQKVPIGRTKVVFAVISRAKRFSVSAASVAAKHKPFAVFAVFRQRSGQFDKSAVKPGFVHFVKTVGFYIAKIPLVQCIKVAGIYTAVCFNNPLWTAKTLEIASFRSLACQNHHKIFFW